MTGCRLEVVDEVIVLGLYYVLEVSRKAVVKAFAEYYLDERIVFRERRIGINARFWEGVI